MKLPILFVVMLIFQQALLAQIAEYKMADTLYISHDGMNPAPGQISKNNKNFYFTMENENTAEEFIYVMKRKKAGKPFSAPEKIKGVVNENPTPAQPSLTEDELAMVYVKVSNNTWTDNDIYIAYREKKSAEFSEFRTLSEMNSPDEADAYPYISPDGLNIYYVKGDYLYHSSRFDMGVKFSQASKVYFGDYGSYADYSGIYGAWLSPDQLQIYFVYSSAIYAADRAYPDTEWSEPYVYCYPRTEDAFISGVSFSSDMKEMFLYVSYDDKDLVCSFKKQ